VRKFLVALVAGASLLAAAPLHAQHPVPKLTSRVTDLTATLDAEQRGSLEAKLAEFEQRKGAQVAALIVPSVKPETIEEYAVRVMEAWKLGRKDINDGVLLVVAKDDHKLRIEVGYGLEGNLTDAASKRIISDFITPRFKEGDFFAGIDAGIDQIISIAAGEALPEPSAEQASGDQDPWPILVIFGGPILLAVSFAAGRQLRTRLRRFPSAAINATGTGAVTGLFFSMVSSEAIMSAIGIGALAFVMTVLGRDPPRWRKDRGRTSRRGSDDDSWSSGWSSSSSSSSSDSDFSGGGGESGGGGASGDW
jgi:uncharacterized protein